MLLAAFDGWNDAGEAATTALNVIGDGLGAAETFATIDPDEGADGEEGPARPRRPPPRELVAEVERYLRDHPGGPRS